MPPKVDPKSAVSALKTTLDNTGKLVPSPFDKLVQLGSFACSLALNAMFNEEHVCALARRMNFINDIVLAINRGEKSALPEKELIAMAEFLENEVNPFLEKFTYPGTNSGIFERARYWVVRHTEHTKTFENLHIRLEALLTALTARATANLSKVVKDALLASVKDGKVTDAQLKVYTTQMQQGFDKVRRLVEEVAEETQHMKDTFTAVLNEIHTSISSLPQIKQDLERKIELQAWKIKRMQEKQEADMHNIVEGMDSIRQTLAYQQIFGKGGRVDAKAADTETAVDELHVDAKYLTIDRDQVLQSADGFKAFPAQYFPKNKDPKDCVYKQFTKAANLTQEAIRRQLRIVQKLSGNRWTAEYYAMITGEDGALIERFDSTLQKFVDERKRSGVLWKSLNEALNYVIPIASAMQHIHESRLSFLHLSGTTVLVFKEAPFARLDVFPIGLPKDHSTTTVQGTPDGVLYDVATFGELLTLVFKYGKGSFRFEADVSIPQDIQRLIDDCTTSDLSWRPSIKEVTSYLTTLRSEGAGNVTWEPKERGSSLLRFVQTTSRITAPFFLSSPDELKDILVDVPPRHRGTITNGQFVSMLEGISVDSAIEDRDKLNDVILLYCQLTFQALNDDEPATEEAVEGDSKPTYAELARKALTASSAPKKLKIFLRRVGETRIKPLLCHTIAKLCYENQAAREQFGDGVTRDRVTTFLRGGSVELKIAACNLLHAVVLNDAVAAVEFGASEELRTELVSVATTPGPAHLICLETFVRLVGELLGWVENEPLYADDEIAKIMVCAAYGSFENGEWPTKPDPEDVKLIEEEERLAREKEAAEEAAREKAAKEKAEKEAKDKADGVEKPKTEPETPPVVEKKEPRKPREPKRIRLSLTPEGSFPPSPLGKDAMRGMARAFYALAASKKIVCSKEIVALLIMLAEKTHSNASSMHIIVALGRVAVMSPKDFQDTGLLITVRDLLIQHASYADRDESLSTAAISTIAILLRRCHLARKSYCVAGIIELIESTVKTSPPKCDCCSELHSAIAQILCNLCNVDEESYGDDRFVSPLAQKLVRTHYKFLFNHLLAAGQSAETVISVCRTLRREFLHHLPEQNSEELAELMDRSFSDFVRFATSSTHGAVIGFVMTMICNYLTTDLPIPKELEEIVFHENYLSHFQFSTLFVKCIVEGRAQRRGGSLAEIDKLQDRVRSEGSETLSKLYFTVLVAQYDERFKKDSDFELTIRQHFLATLQTYAVESKLTRRTSKVQARALYCLEQHFANRHEETFKLFTVRKIGVAAIVTDEILAEWVCKLSAAADLFVWSIYKASERHLTLVSCLILTRILRKANSDVAGIVLAALGGDSSIARVNGWSAPILCSLEFADALLRCSLRFPDHSDLILHAVCVLSSIDARRFATLAMVSSVLSFPPQPMTMIALHNICAYSENDSGLPSMCAKFCADLETVQNLALNHLQQAATEAAEHEDGEGLGDDIEEIAISAIKLLSVISPANTVFATKEGKRVRNMLMKVHARPPELVSLIMALADKNAIQFALPQIVDILVVAFSKGFTFQYQNPRQSFRPRAVSIPPDGVFIPCDVPIYQMPAKQKAVVREELVEFYKEKCPRFLHFVGATLQADASLETLKKHLERYHKMQVRKNAKDDESLVQSLANTLRDNSSLSSFGSFSDTASLKTAAEEEEEADREFKNFCDMMKVTVARYHRRKRLETHFLDAIEMLYKPERAAVRHLPVDERIATVLMSVIEDPDKTPRCVWSAIAKVTNTLVNCQWFLTDEFYQHLLRFSGDFDPYDRDTFVLGAIFFNLHRYISCLKPEDAQEHAQPIAKIYSAQSQQLLTESPLCVWSYFQLFWFKSQQYCPKCLGKRQAQEEAKRREQEAALLRLQQAVTQVQTMVATPYVAPKVEALDHDEDADVLEVETEVRVEYDPDPPPILWLPPPGWKCRDCKEVVWEPFDAAVNCSSKKCNQKLSLMSREHCPLCGHAFCKDHAKGKLNQIPMLRRGDVKDTLKTVCAACTSAVENMREYAKYGYKFVTLAAGAKVNMIQATAADVAVFYGYDCAAFFYEQNTGCGRKAQVDKRAVVGSLSVSDVQGLFSKGEVKETAPPAAATHVDPATAQGEPATPVGRTAEVKQVDPMEDSV